MLCFTFFIALLSFVSTTYSMDPPMDPPIQRTYPLDFKPMNFADDPKDEHVVLPHPITVPRDGASTFEGMPVEDLDTVLAHAPDTARFVLRRFEDKEMMELINSQSSFIVGDYGTGKTVLAKAIAHKVCSTSDWSYEYISSRAFMGKYRNQTCICLREYLKKTEQLKRPTLLIIDQLNKILEYPESSADDTALASSLITNLMDDNERNRNFFFIGIMDRATMVCKRLKSRMLAKTIWLKEPTDPELKRIIFTSKCIDEHTQLHPEVTNEWLTNFLSAAPTGRNYRRLALHTKEKIAQAEAKSEAVSDDTPRITKHHLTTALQSYLAAKKDKEYIDPYENYRDREERLHVEGMFNKFLDSGQLALLEEMLDQKTFFTDEQSVMMRNMLAMHRDNS